MGGRKTICGAHCVEGGAFSPALSSGSEALQEPIDFQVSLAGVLVIQTFLVRPGQGLGGTATARAGGVGLFCLIYLHAGFTVCRA